ncbi:kinase-like domain-containing protein [Mortierella sp. GBAus27b]|nr:kinase-like domain-containing protein [Mortierella sp. GBAus27b]
MINKYLVVRELGRGVHGKVKLCRDTITNEFCAIKIVDKTTRRRLGRSQLSNEQKIRREIAIMKKCDHPNVVKLIEVIDDPTAKKIYLVLEYMEGGEVRWKDTEDKPILSLQEARSIFRDVVLGLEYLHMQGIYHRDIKPANLLLSAEGGVKISDFGVSHFSEKNALERDLENSPDDLELAKTAGSPAFFAPELYPSASTGMLPATTGRPPITKAIDIWALGVTLYCFVYGRCPFIADTEFELFNIIPRKQPVFPDHVPGRGYVNPEIKDLLSRLLEKDVHKRITLKEVKVQ